MNYPLPIKIDLNLAQSIILPYAKMMAVSEPWVTLGININQCKQAFEGLGKECYVLKVEEAIAGFVVLQIEGSFKGYIQTICIEETFRNKGLGTFLLAFCEERIVEISPNIFICVSDFNKRALKLYTEFGFKQVGELENFIKVGYTELLLRKTIGPISGYLSP